MEIHILEKYGDIYGIGVRNCNKGIEFLDYADGKAKTINNPGITIIHNDKDFADVCCVFYDLKDYIAFKNIEKIQYHQSSRLRYGNDTFKRQAISTGVS